MACQRCEHVFCSPLLHFSWTNKKLRKRENKRVKKRVKGGHMSPRSNDFSLFAWGLILVFGLRLLGWLIRLSKSMSYLRKQPSLLFYHIPLNVLLCFGSWYTVYTPLKHILFYSELQILKLLTIYVIFYGSLISLINDGGTPSIHWWSTLKRD